MKFMILANPRSRTKWLSTYLSHSGFVCGHDTMLECHTVDDFLARLDRLDGTIETSAAIGYRIWQQQFPAARFAIIHRMPIEVGESLANLNLADPDWLFIYMQDVMLWRMYDESDQAMLFSFESLARVETRRELCDFVGVPFDAAWDTELAAQRIEVDANERFSRVKSFSMREFYNEIAQRAIEAELER